MAQVIFAARTASFRLVCAVRNVPCAVTYWAIPVHRLGVDSNVWCMGRRGSGYALLEDSDDSDEDSNLSGD